MDFTFQSQTTQLEKDVSEVESFSARACKDA